MQESIGDRFKNFRETIGVTQSNLAEKLGLSAGAIGLVEKNKSFLKSENLIKMINLYNLNLNWLLTGKGEMFHKQQNTFEIKNEYLSENLLTFGMRLNKLRINADLLTEQMSHLLNISASRLSSLVIGEQTPTLNEIISICENFDVTSDWLLFGKV